MGARRFWLLGFALMLVAAGRAAAEPPPASVQVEFVVEVPADTPQDEAVFLAGNLAEVGLWKADGVKLERQEDGRYAAAVSIPASRHLEYKFNRGSWETVEKSATGEEVPNRKLTITKNQRVEVVVARWSKPGPPAPRKSTITGNVKLLDDFDSKMLGNRRPVWVYLPPGYERDVNRRYPVLYMHDGQNVFDDATSFAGEWRADETAQRLIEQEKIEPIIIVAIANAGEKRIDEYTPTPDIRINQGGLGADYAKFVMTEVKPFIDRTYRTLPDRANTAICGSSLGGLISLFIAQQYPDQVGMAGVVSPSLWWNSGRLMGEVEKNPGWTANCRIWLDMGTAEVSELAPSKPVTESRKLAAILKAAGREQGKDFEYLEVQLGEHNEQAWADRFDRILLFFFGS